MTYQVVLDHRALQDIQQAIDYYNKQEPGLGERFENTINDVFQILETHPFYQIRYDNVRCLPLKYLPFMIHYTLNEENQSVQVVAVFNTRKNTTEWNKRIRTDK